MTSSERVVVMAELWMQPGKRLELEAAAREAGTLLRRQPGFVAGRLLHFSGGPSFYLYQTEWSSRAAWEAFWSGEAERTLRAIFEPWLLQPFPYRVHDVKVEA
jgi:heme-degrading monooxygenase HmoA